MFSIRRDCRHMLSLFVAFAIFPSFLGQAQSRPEAPQSSRRSPEVYKKWLNEDVVWIISRQERIDFSNLSTDEQRDEFVVAFWECRNPTPGSTENKFKEEHYRRLAYANTHFAAGVPGWATDRGRRYILYGPLGQ